MGGWEAAFQPNNCEREGCQRGGGGHLERFTTRASLVPPMPPPMLPCPPVPPMSFHTFHTSHTYHSPAQGALMVTDDEMIRGFQRCKELGALPQV